MKEFLDKFFLEVSQELDKESFEVVFWDKTVKKYQKGPKSFRLIIKNPRAGRRILTEKSLGFGEEYMLGNIEVEGNLQSLLKLGTSKTYKKIKPSPKAAAKILLDYITNLGDIKRSRKNITVHYDRGVGFYSLWLDKSLTYSCAYFKNENDTLEQAQQNKYEHICRKLMLKKGEKLVDIGSGFAGTLIYAAENYGIEGVGYTLSKHQYKESLKRIMEEGLSKKLKIYLADYREARGRFDKFVSIGMFEHVGKRYYDDFFNSASLLLKKGGLGLLHTIGQDVREFTDPWIRKYIFPGGEIPVIQDVIDSMGRHNLHFTDIENLRYHYHKTLEEWIKRFEKSIPKIRKMYDEKFIRMWRLYLHGSSSSFKHGGNNLYQIIFTNGINDSLPLTREHIYK